MMQGWLQSLVTTFFEEGIYLLIEQEYQLTCMKYSADNIWTMFYLYTNRHVGLVNIYTFKISKMN